MNMYMFNLINIKKYLLVIYYWADYMYIYIYMYVCMYIYVVDISML